jgi:N-acetylglucosamine malate deacetylase 1
MEGRWRLPRSRQSKSSAVTSGGPKRVLAIAAHPDDIEFMMAGTLILLADAGWDVHCLNVSSGNLGSLTMSPADTAQVRRAEAQHAARSINATWHSSFRNDLEVFYEDSALRRLTAIVREVDPTIVLTHSPQDYMEDHMNTTRLAVTATFARGVPGYRSVPPRDPVQTAVTIYHASPHGLRDGLRRRVIPEAFVNTTTVQERKREALACHRSQRDWLDKTQGMESYIATMDEFARTLGKLSRKFQYAEGWRRRLHYGFSDETADPLRDALKGRYLVHARYTRARDAGA